MTRGLVGAGDKRVNITAISSGDRVGKYLGTYSDLGLADDRGRVWAVTSDLGGWCRDSRGLVGAGEKMVTSIPSPADTGSGSSSRSHFPSLEAFRTIMCL